MTWIQSSFPNPFSSQGQLINRSTFKASFNEEYPDVDHLKRPGPLVEGSAGEDPADYGSLSTATRTAVSSTSK